MNGAAAVEVVGGVDAGDRFDQRGLKVVKVVETTYWEPASAL
ncbi:hypothetical protein [Kribbella sp. VKM Ac-2571]|nr:hypothetical protein [Kribbella sp. VKM Ac-2571]